MRILSGKSTMEEIVVGKLHLYRRPLLEFPRASLRSWQDEMKRFLSAQQAAVFELSALYDRSSHRIGDGMASIFAIHAMLLEDDIFQEQVQNLLKSRHITAEFAVHLAGADIASGFDDMKNSYMQARATDFRDITYRVMRLLLGQEYQISLSEPAILFCDELLPSEVVELEPDHLLGVVCRQGSVESHTSMLLSAYHIPALIGIDMTNDSIGSTAVLDGRESLLYVDPDDTLFQTLGIGASEDEPELLEVACAG
jgi:phosphotransferase system enzyme I (PtsI)